MSTSIQYVPNVNVNFQFSADFDGISHTVVMTWNEFGMRYYISMYDDTGALIVSLPLIGSPNYRNISMTTGYFTTQLIYRPDLQLFTVI
jgi:hypothetical protein